MTITREAIEATARSSADTFSVARSTFTDEALYALEMEHIFEGNWIYMCHESQVRNPKDFFSGWMGRQPVVITRNTKGELGGFVNVCAHRGAVVCREKRGNAGSFACPFHGWVYDVGGKLLSVGGGKHAGYATGFDMKSLGMRPVARVESYRGFVFASLKADVDPLEDYLGGARYFIDLVADQAPQGIEVLRGSSTYRFKANWKLQMENGADGYHVACVHANYVSVLQKRDARNSADSVKAVVPMGVGRRPGGSYGFKNGHIVLWSQRVDPSVSPNFPMQDSLTQKFGADTAFWMLGRSRNLGLYPNLFLMDSLSTQIRHFRPVGPEETEVTSYCFAPVGESEESRNRRVRQFEDFYNASGMATPDDLAEFNWVQQGLRATGTSWNDFSRGAAHWISGPDALAKTSGFDAVVSGVEVEDEGLFVAQAEAWRERMKDAVAERGEPL